MSGERTEILGALRRALARDADPASEAGARATVESRLSRPERHVIPARSQLPPGEQVELFERMAREQAASFVRVRSVAEVPGAIAGFLKAHNLPGSVKVAPQPELEALEWTREPLLEVVFGGAAASDQVAVTGAFAAVAESGTLVLVSGADSPTALNFLPDNHVVVLRADQVVGPYEAAWERLRAAYGSGVLPRTVNFITGPSRTADIEQTIQLGAHGPRRLHIVLVEDAAPRAAGDAA
jgi:L-lactate dehydrogenase complex protein LldG